MPVRWRRGTSLAVLGAAAVLGACGAGDSVDFDTPEMPDRAPTMAPDPPEMDLEPPGG